MKTTVSLRPGTWQALSRGRTGAGSTLRAPERWQTHTAAAADALFDAGGLGYVTAGTVCARGASYPMGLTAGEKQVAALGSLLLFFPDKKYLDLESGGWGSLEAHFSGPAALTLCDENGNSYAPAVSATAPEAPEHGALWLDTSGAPALKRWSDTAARWVAQESYLKLSNPGITGFRAGDAITLSGIAAGSGVIAAGAGYIVLSGEPVIPGSAAVTLRRAVPTFTAVVSAGGRLWGVSGGWAYASADGFTWEKAAPLGFVTAAASLDGKAVFFGENAIHTLTPSGAVQTLSAPGMAGGTAAEVDGRLLYRAAPGICAFDGSGAELLLPLPEAGTALCAALNGRCYISMAGHFLCWDGKTFHRLGEGDASALCAAGDALYAARGGKLQTLGAGDGAWQAWLTVTESVCTLTAVTLTGRFPPGSSVRVFYDRGAGPEYLGTAAGARRNCRLPVLPRKCACLALVLEAVGGAEVEAITAHLRE